MSSEAYRLLTLNIQGYRIILSILRMLQDAEKSDQGHVEMESFVALDTDAELHSSSLEQRALTFRQDSSDDLVTHLLTVYEDSIRISTHVDASEAGRF